MSASDPTAAEIIGALSVPAESGRRGVTRRRFLQAIAAGGAATALPTWLADAAAAATPIGAGDGVLVVLLMGGGNDGLNMVVPTEDGAYQTARRNLAIAPTAALPIGRGWGLHPALQDLKRRFDDRQVAVLRGVGDVQPDLSHFTAMARWMAGDGGSMPTTGWLGRWIDGLPGGDDPFHALAMGTSVPLTLVGKARKGTALPLKLDSGLTTAHKDDWVRRSAECVRAMGAGPTGLGVWGDALAATGRFAVDLTGRVAPLYADDLEGPNVAAQLELAARVINADLGVRVVQVSLGSFDHHSDAGWQHNRLMEQMDAGIARFFAALSPRFLRRTTILTMSEFGRRVQVNQSNGTDHGTASSLFAIGAGVKGGLYGETPSLTRLDRGGNLVPTVDFRSVYATVLDTWLRADPRQVLGGTHENLGFLNAPAA